MAGGSAGWLLPRCTPSLHGLCRLCPRTAPGWASEAQQTTARQVRGRAHQGGAPNSPVNPGPGDRLHFRALHAAAGVSVARALHCIAAHAARPSPQVRCILLVGCPVRAHARVPAAAWAWPRPAALFLHCQCSSGSASRVVSDQDLGWLGRSGACPHGTAGQTAGCGKGSRQPGQVLLPGLRQRAARLRREGLRTWCIIRRGMEDSGCSRTRIMTATPSWKWFRLWSIGRKLASARIQAASASSMPVIWLRAADHPRRAARR